MHIPKYIPHPHQPRNVNKVHKEEQAAGGINAKIAVVLTKRVGTMWTAYSFAVLAIIGLFAILGLLTPIVALLVAWLSQTFIQLVLLPIIMVGQNVLGRHAELIADEQYHTTKKTYADIESIMKHLDDQDALILKIVQKLEAQDGLILEIVQKLDASMSDDIN
ncbi:MAG TPA: hypothetical protein VE843_00640 [Ktedonobacteraceae bacterium]|nr:hypothetical protein [Ktedonobacteraceae bacterium]